MGVKAFTERRAKAPAALYVKKLENPGPQEAASHQKVLVRPVPIHVLLSRNVARRPRAFDDGPFALFEKSDGHDADGVEPIRAGLFFGNTNSPAA